MSAIWLNSLRLFIFLTPIAGTFIFPIIVPIATNKFGLGAGSCYCRNSGFPLVLDYASHR